MRSGPSGATTNRRLRCGGSRRRGDGRRGLARTIAHGSAQRCGRRTARSGTGRPTPRPQTLHLAEQQVSSDIDGVENALHRTVRRIGIDVRNGVCRFRTSTSARRSASMSTGPRTRIVNGKLYRAGACAERSMNDCAGASGICSGTGTLPSFGPSFEVPFGCRRTPSIRSASTGRRRCPARSARCRMRC